MLWSPNGAIDPNVLYDMVGQALVVMILVILPIRAPIVALQVESQAHQRAAVVTA